VAMRSDGTTKYLEIGGASHVSVLFSSAAMRSAQEWSAHVLHLPPTAALPSHRMLIGALGGFVGILLIAGPFLREAVGKDTKEEETVATGAVIGLPRLLVEFAAGSGVIVLLLRFWTPLKRIGLFQGDYLASFVLLLGAVLILLHWRSVRAALTNSSGHLLAAGFAGVVLLLLCTAWFDLTFYEAWMTGAKWARFPFLLAACLPYHVAEEMLLGPVQGKRWRRLALALTLRLISWAAMMGGIFLLHNGEILIGLLAAYLALFNIAQRSGMDMVRTGTGSAAAAGLFGAILQAGFCLVIFPLT
jgi:hypothetical protein